MLGNEALKTLTELMLFTDSVYHALGLQRVGNDRNHNGEWTKDQPSGAIMHYTASNAAYSTRRPFGRIPVLLRRFQVDGMYKVGVQFIVWGDPLPYLMKLRDQWPRLHDMPGLIFCTDHTLASWHAGWVNSWAYGIEVRNVGRVYRDRTGGLYWNRKLKIPYDGEIIALGPKRIEWEPYSHEQLACCVWIGRLMHAVYQTDPELFLGHYHVSSNKIDPGPHFPLKLIRRLSCGDLINEPIPAPYEWGVRLRFNRDHSTVFPQEEKIHGKSEPRFDHQKQEHMIDHDTSEYAVVNADQKLMLTDLGYEVNDQKQGIRTASIFRKRWRARRRRNWRKLFSQYSSATNLMGKRESRLLLRMWNGWQRLSGNR